MKRQRAEPKKTEATAFSFGDPEPVLQGRIYEYVGIWLLDNGRYYSTPVPLSGLARLLKANAYHGPILELKVNMTMRGFRPSAALSRRDMHAVSTDYMVFANAYLQLARNWLGEIVRANHLPAINMRRMRDPERYGLLLPNGQFHEFEAGEVLHLKNYDVCQTIYGLPGYLGAIQSMLLNEDATLFRRMIKKSIMESRGIGNFRNIFIHIPNGREKDIQILPVGDFSTKDELERIKNISRDDIIAAHRIPPAMASIIPTNTAGFGDITKVDAVYFPNEIVPIREILLEGNEVLPRRSASRSLTQPPKATVVNRKNSPILCRISRGKT